MYAVFVAHPDMTGEPVALPLVAEPPPSRSRVIAAAAAYYRSAQHPASAEDPSGTVSMLLLTHLLGGTSLETLPDTAVGLQDLATLRAEADPAGVDLAAPLAVMERWLCDAWEARRMSYLFGHTQVDDTTAADRGCAPRPMPD